MIVATASNAYVLFFKEAYPSRAEFLLRTRARPGTYAAELMGDLHDDIFLRSVELRREYQRYYAKEYSIFSDFTGNFRYLPSELQPKANLYYARYQLIIPYSCYGWIYQDKEGLRLLSKIFRLTPKTL